MLERSKNYGYKYYDELREISLGRELTVAIKCYPTTYNTNYYFMPACTPVSLTNNKLAIRVEVLKQRFLSLWSRK